MPRILENSAFCNCVCHLILQENKHILIKTTYLKIARLFQNNCVILSCDVISTNFSNDDFFAEDFHGVVHPCGLLLHQDHFTKCPFPQQLQVVKITHSLQEQWSKMSRDRGRPLNQTQTFKLMFEKQQQENGIFSTLNIKLIRTFYRPKVTDVQERQSNNDYYLNNITCNVKQEIIQMDRPKKVQDHFLQNKESKLNYFK